VRLTVPLVHAGNRGSAIAWGYAGFCLLYLGTGHLGSRDPSLLTPSVLDRAVAFVPWTVWLYLGQFPLTFSALWWAADDETRSRTFYAMLAATLVAGGVFLAYPTTGERAGVGLAGPTGQAYRLVYGVDVATNWFPSLHVALAALAAAGLAAHGRRTGVGAMVGAALVAASTLTTKQHYLVDAVGGLVVAAGAWCLAGRGLRYGQRTADETRRLQSIPR
jgi:membrane-associated phospholipid phosphatase